MDKKLYFEPEQEVVELKLSGMLCASINEDDNSSGKSDEEGGDDDF